MIAVFSRLADGGRDDTYIEDILTLPLEIFLQTVGIPYQEQDLERLYQDGYTFANCFDNNSNEVLIAEADAAIKDIWDFIEPSYRDYPKASMIAKFVDDMYSMGLGENDIKANIAGSLIITMANTAGISSAFLLRNVIRYPSARALLKPSPELMQKDNTIIEFLRRDNHVKALSRHATTDCIIGGFEMVKGSNIDLFYPGINLDPNHWQNPLSLDFNRNHEGNNSLVFGGSIYMCIGKKHGIAFMKHMLQGFLATSPRTLKWSRKK